jgi:hypothetical protein
MAKTGQDRGPTHSAPAEREALKPTQFPNVDACMAARPNTEGNTFAYPRDAARELGSALFTELHQWIKEHADLRMDVDGIARENLERMLRYTPGGLLRSLWSSIGFTHAYADAFATTAMEMSNRAFSPEGQRGAVYGFSSKLEQADTRSQAKDAECALLIDIFHGMFEAHEELVGERWTPPAPRDESDEATQKAKAAEVAERMRARLAARRAS